MKKLLYITIVLIGASFNQAYAQLDSIQNLDEIVLSDVKLKRFASGYKITVLSDSVIQKSPWSLTDLLRFNSNIYFKENGYGMVSSPSFRGTNASQTAVVWNGININSQLNGQIDFNTINNSNYNSVEIRSGGGSVQYGSGAIGGSVHLSNELTFNKHIDQELRIGYGSFDTKNGNYSISAGADKWSLNAGIAYVDSDNDYKYLGTNKHNSNGEYDNLSFNLNAGYLLNEKHVLKLYHQSFIGNRNFSGTLVAPSKSRYEDVNHRSMLEWIYFHENYTSKLKVVQLHEAFKYFENKDSDFYSFGRINSFIGNHNLNIKLTDVIDLQTILEFSKFKGVGESFGNPARDAFSATALWKHQLSDNLVYGLNFRKDFTSDFKSPFVFSADAAYRFNAHYLVRLNGSKNFRVPTFNDLYWNPGGNLDLLSESSYQMDLGQEFSSKYMDVKLNGYYIKTSDMIQWIPDNIGLSRPQNIANVKSYGAELEVFFKYQIDNHHFNLNPTYSYTVSEDIANKKQLIYVPLHKANLNFGYSFKALEVVYQHLINGEVDIIGGQLDGYNMANLGLSYQHQLSKKVKTILQFNVNNLYSKNYENMAFRPMPNRNYRLQLTLKF